MKFESKLHHKSQEQTSQALNNKKACEHYLLHQTGMKFIFGYKVSATLLNLINTNCVCLTFCLHFEKE